MSVKLPNFTCIIIGDPRTGKTSLLRKVSSKVTDELSAHIGTHHPVIFSTNLGPITFQVRDTEEQECRGSLKNSYFRSADCAIILFDVTAPATYDSVFYWLRKVRTMNGAIPVVLCGSKIDFGTRRVLDDRVKFEWSHKLNYLEVSMRDEQSACAPFLYLAQRLLKKMKVTDELTDISRVESETNVDLETLHTTLDQSQIK